MSDDTNGKCVAADFDLPLPDREKKFLSYLRQLIDSYKELEERMDKYFGARESWESEAALVLEQRKLDRLLRYSASLERDFDRTLVQLERLQRIRKGQPVLPPLNVKIST